MSLDIYSKHKGTTVHQLSLKSEITLINPFEKQIHLAESDIINGLPYNHFFHVARVSK